MSSDPYRPDDLAVKDLPTGAGGEPVGRPGCLAPGVVAVFFLVLTVLYLVYFGILFVNPYVPINPFPPRTPLPSATSTASPTATPVVGELPPLLTAVPPTPTATLISGPGPGQVVEGVFTPPAPGDPSLYTRSPFPFTVYGDAATYIANPNDQECRWASIAGSVTDLGGVPIVGLAVHVVGEGIDEIRFTGTAPTYSLGGYEVFLNGAPLRGQYVVQLLSQTGTPISAEFTVTTSPVCEENVAIVNFVQNFAY
jgi:hypothetical protein